MVESISKSQFKAKALEFFRQVEASGEPIVITDNGRPTLEIRRYRAAKLRDPFDAFCAALSFATTDPTGPGGRRRLGHARRDHARHPRTHMVGGRRFARGFRLPRMRQSLAETQSKSIIVSSISRPGRSLSSSIAGALQLAMPTSPTWVCHRAETIPGILFVPVDNEIAVKSFERCREPSIRTQRIGSSVATARKLLRPSGDSRRTHSKLCRCPTIW